MPSPTVELSQPGFLPRRSDSYIIHWFFSTTSNPNSHWAPVLSSAWNFSFSLLFWNASYLYIYTCTYFYLSVKIVFHYMSPWGRELTVQSFLCCLLICYKESIAGLISPVCSLIHCTIFCKSIICRFSLALSIFG